MKILKTQPCFSIADFKDRNGETCSLQMSSIATEACIWLGVDEANPQVMEPGKGWVPVPFPEGTLFTTRMHLTQSQVKKLLPHLQKFAETGEL